MLLICYQVLFFTVLHQKVIHEQLTHRHTVQKLLKNVLTNWGCWITEKVEARLLQPIVVVLVDKGQDGRCHGHTNVPAQLVLAHQLGDGCSRLEQRRLPTVGMAAPGWSRGGARRLGQLSDDHSGYGGGCFDGRRGCERVQTFVGWFRGARCSVILYSGWFYIQGPLQGTRIGWFFKEQLPIA
jgi:hypothetical protein